jgi:hypothetical protein
MSFSFARIEPGHLLHAANVWAQAARSAFLGHITEFTCAGLQMHGGLAILPASVCNRRHRFRPPRHFMDDAPHVPDLRYRQRSVRRRAARRHALRAWLAKSKLDGFLVPRADEHQGEYVAPGSERLRWLTGFTGSAGAALVLRTGRHLRRRPLHAAGAAADRHERLHVASLIDNAAAAWIERQSRQGRAHRLRSRGCTRSAR